MKQADAVRKAPALPQPQRQRQKRQCPVEKTHRFFPPLHTFQIHDPIGCQQRHDCIAHRERLLDHVNGGSRPLKFLLLTYPDGP